MRFLLAYQRHHSKINKQEEKGQEQEINMNDITFTEIRDIERLDTT